MKSLDTNLLVYAANEGCKEHAVARELAETLLAEPQECETCGLRKPSIKWTPSKGIT